ncbi:hypothetical protein [Actinomyces weissii]|uniref:Uncharacterized protein n=1 Tax=Actinomyces weissii TaxID=675090 RepID=A0A7T7MAP1_9ACTO|nr:hypothetical protein [Actinomyces weissii]QQM67855.1 hypothetical protein JG540_02975 [Actinomyces weissii]
MDKTADEESLAEQLVGFASAQRFANLGTTRSSFEHGEHAWVITCILSQTAETHVTVPQDLLSQARALYVRRQDFEAQGVNTALSLATTA